MDQERAANHAAGRRLKDAIARAYKPGRFVAIAGGQIVADADGFDELRSRLVAAGKDTAEVLVVQAGVEYPEAAWFIPGFSTSDHEAAEPPPLSEEELLRREQEADYSTAEILAHLEKL